MIQHSLMTLITQDETEPRWFSADGCVVRHVEHAEVFAGGTLVGSFGRRDEVQRNLLLVHLSEDRRIKQVKLAWAFCLTVQQVWVIRRRVERHGVEALFNQPGRGGKTVVTPRLFKKIIRSFDAGQQVGEVHAALMRSKVKEDRVSYRSVCRVRTQWLAQQEQAEETACQVSASASEADVVVEGSAEEDSDTQVLEAQPLCGGHNIQHLGAWLLLSMVHALGFHAAVAQGWEVAGQWGHRLPVVLALGLGQRCVEGGRRLRTPSAAVLLRAQGAPTANWTRRVLKHYLGDPEGSGDSSGSCCPSTAPGRSRSRWPRCATGALSS